MQRFKIGVVNGLGTDQRGGEASGAGVVDDRVWESPSQYCFHMVASRGTDSGQLTAPMNPAGSTRTNATRHSRSLMGVPASERPI